MEIGVLQRGLYSIILKWKADWFEEFKRTQEITHGMDFGFSQDPTTVVSTVVDLKNKKLFIYDEHYKKAMLTDDIKQMLIKKNYR